MGVEELAAALGGPQDWARTAPALAATGDPAAIPALVRAYDAPREGSRRHLLAALRELGGDTAALALAGSPDPEERRLATRLMHLLGGERHAAALASLAADADVQTAALARRAFGAQPRTGEWAAIARRLARGPDPELAAAAAGWLAGEP